jgi:sugar/nucleoside kinase (ribokinase family)
LDIMMVGHFAKDRLVVDGGSVALRRIGLRVAVVTRLHPDDFPRLDELKREGVQVFAASAPETSGIENIYDSADMERLICKLLGFTGPFRREEIPSLSAQIYLIAPIIAGEVDLPLLKSLAARGPVGLDVQGFVRVRENDHPSAGSGQALVFRQWPDMAEGLAHVTYLKVDRAEAELLTGQTDLRAAARQLAAYGPREVVVTQSSGVTVYADGQIYEAPFTPRSLAGRTGRGDTCFATYVGKRLSAPAEEACRFAAAVTTLKQEQPGPWRGTLDDVAAVLMDRHQQSARGQISDYQTQQAQKRRQIRREQHLAALSKALSDNSSLPVVDSPPQPDAVEPAPAPASTPSVETVEVTTQPKQPWRPPPDHPWRRRPACTPSRWSCSRSVDAKK